MNTSPVEAQIAEFLAEYSPEVEARLRKARQRLRACFPRGFELVFNNYNALVFGISPSERASEAFISVTGYPRWVTLFFLHGAELQDPAKLLDGTGKQVRGVRLTSGSDVDTPQLQALVAQAARPLASRLMAAPPLSTVIKVASVKRRSRRPAGALRPLPARAGVRA
jgi:hypothetical protein